VEYVIGLFADRAQAGRGIDAVKAAGVPYTVAMVKAPQHTVSARGVLERVFGMPEPHATLEAHGVPHDAAQWLQNQVEQGRTMVVIHTDREPERIRGILSEAGALDVRVYTWYPPGGP